MSKHTLLSNMFLGIAILSLQLYAVDSQNRLAIAGYIETNFENQNDTQATVTRYLGNGTIDTTFGNGGLATLNNLRHGVALSTTISPDQIDNQDLIAIAGVAIRPETLGPTAFVARFTSTGTLDTSFGIDGVVWMQQMGEKGSVATDIQFATEFLTGYPVTVNRIDANNRYRATLFILNLDGSIFTSFDFPADIKLNATNSLITTPSIAVGKSISDGTPKPLVAISGGFTTIPSLSGEFLGMDNNRIINPELAYYACGRHQKSGLLVKFTVSGFTIVLDATFGDNGIATFEFGTKQTVFQSVKAQLDENGEPRVYVCGTARSLQSRMFIAAIDPNTGQLAQGFGVNGIKTITEGPSIQTIGQDLSFSENCGSGLFALGGANGQAPLIANLHCDDGSLLPTYGDKGIASLETEQKSSIMLLKETVAANTTISPAPRLFNTQFGNIFTVSLLGNGVFKLQPGRYLIDAQAPIVDTQNSQLALYNQTLDLVDAVGNANWQGIPGFINSFLTTELFIPKPMSFVLQHHFTAPGPNFSLGQSAPFTGLIDYFAQMSIKQL